MITQQDLIFKLTEHDLREEFGSGTFNKANLYQKKGLVLNYQILNDGTCIEAKVQGSRRQPYRVSIELERDEISFEGKTAIFIEIDGTCSCPMEYNCKHVGAVLLEAIRHPAKLEANRHDVRNLQTTLKIKSEEISNMLKTSLSTSSVQDKPVFERWFHSLNEVLTKKSNPAPVKTQSKSEYQLLYILKQNHQQAFRVVDLIIARQLKRGGFGNAYKSLSPNSETHFNALQPMDYNILHRLEVDDRLQNHFSRGIYHENYELGEQTDDAIFSDIINTNRCFITTHQNKSCLQLGPAKIGEFSWRLNSNGSQQFICLAEGKQVDILFLSSPWYLDSHQNICGPLKITMKPNLVKTLLFAPPLEPQNVTKMQDLLNNKLEHPLQFPAPQTFKISKLVHISPKPKLTLFGTTGNHYFFYKNWGNACELPLGRISFIYNNAEVQITEPLTLNSLDSPAQTLNVISRNLTEETKWVESLLEQGIGFFSKRCPNVQLNKIKPLDLLVAPINETAAQEAFLYEKIPVLQQAGWEVLVDKTFPVQYVVSVDDWYTEIREDSDTDWFSMELGFLVNGQKINILPILTKAIEHGSDILNEKYLNSIADKSLILPVPGGPKVKVPVQRIKGILATLSELYDPKSLNDSGLLRISRLRATLLMELEKAMAATQMRWLGETQLKQLSEKLSQFKGVETVKIPTQFKGKLRDYQKTGVNWLNFLRSYQLPGVLADDMGLGKTIQTLAHVLIEKKAGRMENPCLIVAPTSLMENWRSEAAQFTPTLKLLILQGQNRKNFSQDIIKSDVVLTTYPLLVRDKDMLLAHQYSMVILDEAQFIKNANTKAYLILQQIRAQHRLCLTGTPMENHLGELWSLFNFLSPGLLGSMKQFTQIFRTPIERLGNGDRRLSLNQRLKPYMLRRTKEEVVLELPPKTEIIHKLTFEEAQRDLYESIRLSMETKIKKAIEAKSIASSQIVILDALLKLRQVCCDPRLLRLEQAKKITESVKLNFLMEMLSELMAEKRKVLIFSSFTSMLTLIEDALQKQKMNYVKLTGSTVDRKTPIQQFQNGEIPIFLISLKAGGTGLNLTAADTVIHYDPWWNPAAEAQATDRAHRIGQTKPVFVYKLVTTGTVEEKILMMQEKKRSLLAGIFDENQGAKAGAISAEDLKFLFQPIV